MLEVNPRYCASMELVERASGASLFGLHRAACRGELLPSAALGPGVWGKAIVYATRTVAAPDTTAWLDEGVRDVPHPGEVIRAGHPICTVLASGSTRARCRAALDGETRRILAACAPVPGRDAGSRGRRLEPQADLVARAACGGGSIWTCRARHRATRAAVLSGPGSVSASASPGFHSVTT